MAEHDLASLDGLGQADLVARGELSAPELVEAAIGRIERINPQLNAIVIPLFEQAREWVRSDALGGGPFRGVPLLLKDLGCPVAGLPLYAGTKFLKDRAWVSRHDSVLGRRLREAGFVIVGKANTPELGLSPTTEPRTFGATRNPWDPTRIAGGSSGGSGAAVAAGLVPVAHAGDGGGSIRSPAGICGQVGLKPSRGRNSLGPSQGEGWGGNVTEHVITRSVRDTAAVLDCVSGPATGDPYFAPPPQRAYLDEVGRDPGRLRVGSFSSNAHISAHPESKAAVRGALELLHSLGHEVSEEYPAALDEPGLGEGGAAVVSACVARELDSFSEWTGDPLREGDVEPATWAMAERGRSFSARQYAGALERQQAFGRRLRGWWSEAEGEDGFDVLVTPTAAQPTPEVGSLQDAPVERILKLAPYTMLYNISGQPAISLPLHWTSEGLPMGVQFVARYGGEDLLIRLASQLEQARPWASRRPPIHA
ncbi:MAG: amidase [Proteobacteria bacterium]|nr:amidase [Pseudomonadota bacterium]